MDIDQIKNMSFPPLDANKYGLEDRIDFLEYYHMCYNTHFLYPLDTTKIFTIKFKDNQDIDAYGMIFDKISKEYKDVDIYLLQIHDTSNNIPDDEKKEYDEVKFDGGYVYTKFTKMNNTKSRVKKPRTIVFIENIQNTEFGHYGVIFYDGQEYYYFDSMLSGGANPRSAYLRKFVYCTDVYFELKKEFIIIGEGKDGIYDKCQHNSLEIIGGEITLPNMYTAHLLRGLDSINGDDIEFYTNLTFMGPDTQNQYCFMWTFLYIFILLESGADGWRSFLKSVVCDQHIVPICLIKYFCTFIVKLLGNGNAKTKKVYRELMAEPLFVNFFNSFISNSLNYEHCFNKANNVFHLYLNTWGVDVMNNNKTNYTIKDIVGYMFGFVTAYNNVVEPIEQDMGENTTFEVADCDIKFIPKNVVDKFLPEIQEIYYITTIALKKIPRSRQKIGIPLVNLFFENYMRYDQQIRNGFQKLIYMYIYRMLIEYFEQLVSDDGKIYIDSIGLNGVFSTLADNSQYNDKIQRI